MSAMQEKNEPVKILSRREQFRDRYWQKRDPIIKDRLLWRAQTFRHLVHLLPTQSILELGCDNGLFTHQLRKVTRSENLITAATFKEEIPAAKEENSGIEFINLTSFPGELNGRSFDFIIAMDLLDRSNNAWFLNQVFSL